MSKEVPMKKKPLYKHLYVQVLFAIACGVLLGHFYPDTGAAMKSRWATASSSSSR